MKVISIANHKGGVGKTTLTHSIAEALSFDHKVLMIDFDPQASLTAIFDAFNTNTTVTIEDCLDYLRKKKVNIIDKAIQPIEGNPNLFLIAASKFLQEQDEQSNIFLLKEAISSLSDQFDYVLIDNAPGKTKLTEMSMIAADKLVIVAEAAYLSYKGIELLKESIQDVREDHGASVELLGVIINKFDGRTAHNKEVRDLLAKDNNILGVISTSVKMADCAVSKMGICAFAPSSKQAVEVRKIVDAIR